MLAPCTAGGFPFSCSTALPCIQRGAGLPPSTPHLIARSKATKQSQSPPHPALVIPTKIRRYVLTFLPSHVLTFLPSHLLAFTRSHVHTFSHSHILTFTRSHLHTFGIALYSLVQRASASTTPTRLKPIIPTCRVRG